MNIANLKYFLAVAEELNITKASQKLYITQQSLSESIAHLEKEYHIKLFKRKPNFRLTFAGEHFVQFAKQIISLDAHMRNEMTDIAHQDWGTLSIGVRPPYNRILLPFLLPSFTKTHPHVRLHILAAKTPALVQALIEGEVDFCMGLARYMRNKNFTQINLWSDHYCIVLPEQILRTTFQMTEDDLLQGKVPDFGRLRDVPLILRKSTTNCRATSNIFLLQHGVDSLNVLMELDDSIQPLLYCSQGCCATFVLGNVFSYYVKHCTQTQKLYAFPIENAAFDTTTVICYHRGRYFSRAAQDFIALIQEAAASGVYF